jgi:MFS family permease
LTATSVPSKLEVLKIKEFRHFILSRFFYIMALRMVFTVVGFQVYEIAKHLFDERNAKLKLGFIGLSEVIPALLLALYAGVVVDKANKKRLLLRGQVFYLLCSLGFLTTSYSIEQGSIGGKTGISLLYACMFFTGIIRAFTGSAFNAFLAQLVTREQLVQASTISSISWLSAAVAGPVTAGILLSQFSISVTYAAVVLLVGLAIYFMSRIAAKPVLLKKETNNWAGIKEAVGFVMRSKILLGAISLDLFAVLFGGAVAMIPVYASDILHVGKMPLGWLNSAEYIGSFLIMFLLLANPIRKRQGYKLLYAIAGFGLCTLVFAISTNFWVSMFALIAVGLFDGVSVVIRSNIMQLYTPDHMRGRVSAVNSMFINSSNEIGQFESGAAAAIMGTVPSVIFGGCMTLLIVLLVAWRAPALRKMQY